MQELAESTVPEGITEGTAAPRSRDAYLRLLDLMSSVPDDELAPLATELSRVETGRTLYILDEPTTGLHFEDVRVLLEVLQALVERGNTVVVIEHNLDVIKCADWIVDLGPEGGDQGGTVVAAGTPEAVARVRGSHTGEALRQVLP